jgi:hypothetical protein
MGQVAGGRKGFFVFFEFGDIIARVGKLFGSMNW